MSVQEELPEASVRRRRRLTRVAWIVPVLAAIVAGYVVFERWQQHGPEITIRFSDGGGLRVGVTPLKYRGVRVGEVTGISLDKDLQRVNVRVRMERSAEAIAREGATFWIVRPVVGIGNITGLGTVLTGPEIQALPGKGKERSDFVGLDSAPVALEEKGLKIVLRTARPKSLRPNSPVYYRGVEVGVVQEIGLAPGATQTDVTLLVRERYAPLVQPNTVFWNASGATFKAGLFSGIKIDVESLQALAAGGVEFATPTANEKPVKPGTVFALHEGPRKEWLAWAPKIALSPKDEAQAAAKDARVPTKTPAREARVPAPGPQAMGSGNAPP
jgi:paraquat-inducible protein B